MFHVSSYEFGAFLGGLVRDRIICVKMEIASSTAEIDTYLGKQTASSGTHLKMWDNESLRANLLVL